jgi:hypothetical protein
MTRVKNSLASLFPHVAVDWHPLKNGFIDPFKISAFSKKKAWWLCPKGHVWESVIYYRSRGAGCPQCRASSITTKGKLMVDHDPELLDEWHPEKNGSIDPTTITVGSRVKVWWMCENRHEWQAYVKHRCKGTGCPYCKGRRVGMDNSLAQVLPDLAKEWHPTYNDPLTPFDVRPGANRKVWWLCSNGHQWKAHIYARSAGTGCPHCYEEFCRRQGCMKSQ